MVAQRYRYNVLNPQRYRCLSGFYRENICTNTSETLTACKSLAVWTKHAICRILDQPAKTRVRSCLIRCTRFLIFKYKPACHRTLIDHGQDRLLVRLLGAPLRGGRIQMTKVEALLERMMRADRGIQGKSVVMDTTDRGGADTTMMMIETTETAKVHGGMTVEEGGRRRGHAHHRLGSAENAIETVMMTLQDA